MATATATSKKLPEKHPFSHDIVALTFYFFPLFSFYIFFLFFFFFWSWRFHAAKIGKWKKQNIDHDLGKDVCRSPPKTQKTMSSSLYRVFLKKVLHKQEEKVQEKMKMTSQEDKNLVQVQQHHGVYFCARIIFKS